MANTQKNDAKTGDQKAEEQSKTATAGENQPTPNPPEPKQGVVEAGDLKNGGPKRWKVPGFKGTYRGIFFNDEGESDKPVSTEVGNEFRTQYPGFNVTEIE